MPKKQAEAQRARDLARLKRMEEKGIAPAADAHRLSADGLPATNLHMHFRGSIPARATAHFTPYTGEFEDAVSRIREENYYAGAKDLSCYLKHYTPTSNRIPVDTPAYAEAAARQIGYEYAEQGVVLAELRLPAFGDISGFGKFSDERKGDGELSELSEFSQTFLQAVARGLEDGSKLAKDHGYEPTAFGLILEGNRFTPGVMFGKDQGTREERIEKSIAAAIPKVARTYEEAIRQVKLEGNPAMICGVGLAGLEDDHPASAFAECYRLIHAHNDEMAAAGKREKRIGISIHAGEVGTPEQATQAVIDAIKAAWNPNTRVRIGHGILADKEKVKEAVGEEIFDQIHFELCATSNYQIAHQLDESEPHPSKDVKNKNWSSDNDAISGPVGHEYRAAGITPLEARNDMLNGMTGAFVYHQLPAQARADIVDRSKKRWDAAGVTENAAGLVFESTVASVPARHDH